MRDLILITKEPMEIEACFDEIKKIYKSAKKYNDEIQFGNPPKSLYFWFPSIKIIDKSEDWDEEELEKIPSGYNYYTNITFHLTSVTKNVVKALEKIYSDMIIEDEDENFYSIEEYLKKEFDY